MLLQNDLSLFHENSCILFLGLFFLFSWKVHNFLCFVSLILLWRLLGLRNNTFVIIVRHMQKKIIDYHYWLLEYKLPSLVSNMLFSTGLIHFCSKFFILFIYFFIIFINDKKNPTVLKMYCTYIFITLSIHINIKV